MLFKYMCSIMVVVMVVVLVLVVVVVVMALVVAVVGGGWGFWNIGSAAILFISCDACSIVSQKSFVLVFFVNGASHNTLQNGVSHKYACVKPSAQGLSHHLGECDPRSEGIDGATKAPDILINELQILFVVRLLALLENSAHPRCEVLKDRLQVVLHSLAILLDLSVGREGQLKGFLKPGGFQLFRERSWLCRGPFLVGRLSWPRKRKRTSWENREGQIGKSRPKMGKSQTKHLEF